MSLIIPANTLASGGFAVDNSLRFNDGSSDSLTKSYSSAGNLRTWTYSAWFKLSLVPAAYRLFSIGTVASGPIFSIFFTAGDLRIENDNNSSQTLGFRTDQVFRDPSAWSHLVVACDTTQGTNTNRFKIYHNGSQITSFSTTNYPDQNTDTNVNGTTGSATIGARAASPSNTYFDGYMSEVVMIDGQQLTPTSFGEFDEDSGVWKPIDVSGLTFGTNGFYLDFEDSGALGDDVSGNGNDFTVNNLTAIDQTTDTPTNNFATLNPLNASNQATLSDGNSTLSIGSNSWKISPSTIAVSSGKWYVEHKISVNNGFVGIGVIDTNDYANNNNISYSGQTANSVMYYSSNGQKYINDSNTSYGATYTANDIIGIALDLDSGTKTITFYKNNASQGAINLPTAGSEEWLFLPSIYNATVQTNFGNPPFTGTDQADGNGYGSFEYAPPSLYYALNTKNLSEFG